MKILIASSGVHHNDYCGVDGSSNLKIPMSETLAEEMEVYYTSLDLGYETFSNPVLSFMEPFKYHFTMSMKAVPLPFEKAIEEEFDFILVFSRPRNEWSYRYPFDHQSWKVEKLLNKGLEESDKTILYDLDEWAGDWGDYIDAGVELWRSYEKQIIAPSKFVPPMSYMPLGDMWVKLRVNINMLKKYLLKVWGKGQPFDIAYAGNVYGRSAVAHSVFKALSEEFKLLVTGNWTRPKDSYFLKELPRVSFIGSSPHWTTIPLMSLSKFSLIIGNNQHIKHGVLPCRVFEAWVAMTPIIVDKSYDKYTSVYKSYPHKFGDPEELVEIVKAMDDKGVREEMFWDTDAFVKKFYVKSYTELILEE